MSERRSKYKPGLQDCTNLEKVVKVLLPIILLGFVLFEINWGLYTSVAPEKPFDIFSYPYNQDFGDIEIHRWFTEEDSANWSISEEALVHMGEDTSESRIFVPHWLVGEQPYRVSVQIDLGESGSSGGINFNAQYPDIFEKHHRVMATRKGNNVELSSGLAGENDSFEEQVRVSMDSLKQPFRLDVAVEEDVYSVQINGQTVIENRPLLFQDGLIGLIASGNSVVFDDLVITRNEDINYDVDLGEIEVLPSEIDKQTVGSMVYTSNFAGDSKANGWIPFSGDWDIIDGYLVQQDPYGFDLGIAYEPDIFQSYILQVAFTHREGLGAGVLFNMSTHDQIYGAHMVRFAESGNGVFWGYFDENNLFIGQGYKKIPTKDNGSHTIKVVSSEETYSIYIDNQQIAVDVPLFRNSGHIGLTTSRSTAAFGLVDVTVLLDDLESTGSDIGSNWTSPIRISKSFYGSGFQPAALESQWMPISGHWQAVEDALIQSDQGGYDFGIGYSGEIFQNYRLDVPITHIHGTGGGILFNMPLPDDLQWASMIRYSGESDELMWGYFNEERIFKGQGSIAVLSPGVETHILSVISKENTYDVLLDGQIMGQNIPLARVRGYIGLVTSRSTASFGPLTVADSFFDLQSNMHDNMQIISGDWSQVENVITQSSTEQKDHILNTGVLAESYTFETTIVLPDNPLNDNTGAGVIFHMESREDWTNAHLVRLINDGGGMFWGYFDQEKKFIGQGWASFEQIADYASFEESYNLKIVVRNDTYDFSINGIEIFTNVELINTKGYIGLMTFGGPVDFENTNLIVGVNQ